MTTTIENTPVINSDLKAEIYANSFLRHPICLGSDSVRTYILMKHISDMCLEKKDMKGLLPEDFIITMSEYREGFFFIKYNDIFGGTKNVSLLVITADETHREMTDYCSENICYFSPIAVFHNLTFVGRIKEEIPPVCGGDVEPETKYENENCPVCFCEYTDYDDATGLLNDKELGFYGCCGHKICESCYERIMDTTAKCPECRTNWERVSNGETIYYTLEDIEELCECEDDVILNEIVNIGGLVDYAVRADGYSHILGYEDETFYECYEMPDKYRERCLGGNAFFVFLCEQEWENNREKIIGKLVGSLFGLYYVLI